MILTTFNENWGWRGELYCFIVPLYKYVFGTLKHKQQAAVFVLDWVFLT